MVKKQGGSCFVKPCNERIVIYLHTLRLPLTSFTTDPHIRFPNLPNDMPRTIHVPTSRVTTLYELLAQRSLCSVHPYFPCSENPITGVIGYDDCVGGDCGREGYQCFRDCLPLRLIVTHAVDSEPFYKAVNKGLDIMGHCLMPSEPNKKV